MPLHHCTNRVPPLSGRATVIRITEGGEGTLPSSSSALEGRSYFVRVLVVYDAAVLHQDGDCRIAH